MPTILISGAASGLGEACMRSYQEQPDIKILAVDRAAFEAPGANVKTYQVGISSQGSINHFANVVKGEPIDLFIHSVGVRGLVPQIEQSQRDDVAACETLSVMDAQTVARTFEISALGAFMLLRAMLPNLQMVHGKVIVMLSRMGSVENNQHPNKDAGSAYAYQASKAALNMIMRSFAADIRT